LPEDYILGERPMTGVNEHSDAITGRASRRTAFCRLAGAMAAGFAGLRAMPSRAQPVAAPEEGPDWPGKLSARHRQVFDAYTVNGGHSLLYAHTFLATSPPKGAAVAVLVLRADAVVLGVNDAIWAKYKLGEAARLIDPATKAIAVKNPFLNPPAGALLSDDMAVDRLLAAGAILGVCNVALHGVSRAHAAAAGVSPEAAYAEWAADLIPGITLLPSGVWGVNRAQEGGCTYCAGG
jgi:hypothetical protein